MKWFRHFTNAHRDDKLVWLRSKYGIKGIGQYWILLEAVAEQMKGEHLSPEATFTKNQLASLLGVKQNQLTSLLVDYDNKLGINSQCYDNIIKISIPKLLIIKDNYHKDLQGSCKRLGSITKDTDTDSDYSPPTPSRGSGRKEENYKPIPGIDPQPMTEEQQKEFNARMKKITDQMKGAFDD